MSRINCAIVNSSIHPRLMGKDFLLDNRGINRSFERIDGENARDGVRYFGVTLNWIRKMYPWCQMPIVFGIVCSWSRNLITSAGGRGKSSNRGCIFIVDEAHWLSKRKELGEWVWTKLLSYIFFLYFFFFDLRHFSFVMFFEKIRKGKTKNKRNVFQKLTHWLNYFALFSRTLARERFHSIFWSFVETDCFRETMNLFCFRIDLGHEWNTENIEQKWSMTGNSFENMRIINERLRIR